MHLISRASPTTVVYSKTLLIWWDSISGPDKNTHFIATESFKDTVCCIDVMVLYLYKMSTSYKNHAIVTWMLGSEINENVFAQNRISRYHGRRTSIYPSLDLSYGCEKVNRLNFLTRNYPEHHIGRAVAHSRGKNLLRNKDNSRDEIEEFGKDITYLGMVAAMQKGTENLYQDLVKYGILKEMPNTATVTSNAARGRFLGTDEVRTR